jgi:LuxR family transcriptional regulator, maltose regulon positive regulatory protein
VENRLEAGEFAYFLFLSKTKKPKMSTMMELGKIRLIPSLNHKPTLLVVTKLSAPQRRANLVPRPHLLDQLEEGTKRALTLVCAPAGYGKSTLLAEWMACLRNTSDNQNPTTCWLSLDEGDNDPNIFLRYLVAAFGNGNPQMADESLWSEARAMLDSFPSVPFQTILSVLINELDKLSGPIYLILDDYQFINNPTIHNGLAFFLDHLPAAVHVIIATRSDPPLPLAKLRVSRQLTEIRADDLRFDQNEAGSFLNQVMNLSLSPEYITVLETRTEGWIAGLQMAALAMQSLTKNDRDDLPRFIQAFSGTHHYILDYLIEEVLNRQPEHIRVFLLHTAILDRLCGPLCDEVLDLGATSSSQAVLEQMEKENLFLISLDEEHQWFRYHHLFADLLRNRLSHQYPDEIPSLHLRASAWFERNKLMEEAVNHALFAKDIEQAGRLINRMAESMIAKSGSFKLYEWIRRLPDEYVRTQPWLCIALGWAYGFQGLLAEQDDYLKEAENHIHPDDPLSLQKEWRAHILSLRSFVASTVGNFPEMIRLGNEALDLISQENAVVRVSVGYNLGRTYVSLGDFARADEVLWETARLCMQAGVHHIIAPNIGTISREYRLQGQLHKTIESLRSLQIYLEEHNPKSIYVSDYAYLGNIDVLREWNHLEQAEEMARKTLESLEPWNSHNCTCPCATLLARIFQAEGKLNEAQSALDLAAKVIQRNVPFGDIRSDLISARVQYWLATGQITLAEDWMDEFLKTFNSNDAFSIIKEQDEITLSRVLIAKQKFQEALEILSRMEESAETGGRNGRLVEILVLKAKSFYQKKNDSEALKVLEKCLTLARPEGYLRVFLDEGQPMQLLLNQWLAHASSTPLREYTLHLFNQFDSEPNVVKVAHEKASPNDNLIEPLTGRELEVLHLMAQGNTNQEIAGKLIVASGTIKAHAANIYRKLDAANRTEAVTRARQLGILL